MTVFYLNALGPNSKSFLMSEYILTDLAITDIPQWTTVGTRDQNNEIFKSQKTLLEHLSRHRQYLSKTSSDVFGEIDFYTDLIDKMLVWWMDRLSSGQYVEVWPTVMGYAKVTIAALKIGIERALGTYFFAVGGFGSKDIFEMYNKQVNTFNAFYNTAKMYMVDVQEMDTFQNVTARIQSFRFTIMNTDENNHTADITLARNWFDNVTVSISSIRELQQILENNINVDIDDKLGDITTNIVISIVLMIFVLCACPVVVVSTEALSSSIHRYATTLVDKTNELSKEKRKTEHLLYQIIPRSVAEKLKKKGNVEAEYFKSVTIGFCDIHNFASLVADSSPSELVELLNSLFTSIDDRLDNHDVYKVETINDCYMLASGVPKRNKKRHVVEIASLSLDLLRMMENGALFVSGRTIRLRFGINTGPCMAGVLGSAMPRYCLFGDTVNTASRMMSCGEPNKIHISPDTHTALNKCGGFVMETRGEGIHIKGKGDMQTYWLLGKSGSTISNKSMIKENVVQEFDALDDHKRMSSQRESLPNHTSNTGLSDHRDTSSMALPSRKVSETQPSTKGKRASSCAGLLTPKCKRSVSKVSPQDQSVGNPAESNVE
ncbi:soluble guanylate cyclase gcy-35-like [Mizuhopecten yessoensis]|uniref:soluble guanylate cyclase gcy-35-like n=1 Tax=Mizuhopecten yessoensis TaxID=6573 RepID=UPI000B45DDF9|nr:soluble guanylate cyclase gcy-35-like [Mizuhopecten yessoensis]